MNSLLAFESNPSVLACRAAIELDNILLDRISDFKAIPLLIENLHHFDSLAGVALDPGEALVLNRAIANSTVVTTPMVTTDELLKNTSDIRSRLQDVISNPKEYRINKPEEIKKLRAFCIELSKSVSSFTRTMNEMEPKHPFRR